MKINIRNLPGDVTEQEVEELVSEYAGVKSVLLNKEGNPDKVAAWVEVDTSKSATTVVADRINGLLYRERRLATYVPVLFDREED